MTADCREEPSTIPMRRVRMAFVRATLHDTTPAIERAVEASQGLVSERAIFCWNRTGADLPASETRNGVRIERFGKTAPPRSFRMALRTLQYQWWLFRKLWAFRPDAVQVLDFESGWPARLACLRHRARFIYDMRDPVALCYPLPPWLKWAVQLADDLLLSLSNGYVIPSEWLRSCLGRWGRTQRPVAVVRNTCHDWSEAAIARPSESTSRPARIAFVGYLVESRGASQLLDLCAEHPEDARLVVAGACRATDLRERLEQNPGVEMLGHVPRESAFRVMRDADLVSLLYNTASPVNVLASPNKFFESMMLGTPVIVSEGMNLAELVRERGLGYVVPYGDAAALRRVADDIRQPGRRDEFRARCRDYFLAECQLSGDVDRYRDFYRQVLGRAA